MAAIGGPSFSARVHRGRDELGVSVNQACTDLNRYSAFAPNNIVSYHSARTYMRGSEFQSRFLEPDMGLYLGSFDPSKNYTGAITRNARQKV